MTRDVKRPRKYTKRKRAEREEQTRSRIVEATMELHEDLGAARTTVTAIAERAGVQRLTVYRHFPDEANLLEACTSTWLERNPMPAADVWNASHDAVERVRAALEAFYAYYRRTDRMWRGAYRDVDVVPDLAARMALVEAYLDGVAADLVTPMKLRGKASERALIVVRHGLRYSTWQSLARAGRSGRGGPAGREEPAGRASLSDGEAATLLVRWIECVAN